jgi:CheY-like chemotaxis protein
MPQHYAIITDQRAEGSPESHEEREPASPKQTTLMPALHPKSTLTSPSAETGVMPVVSLPGEGMDDNSRQDAALTTDETNPVSQGVNLLATEGQLTALIVEDTLELAEILQVTLQRMQIATTHESHVGRAVARFNENNFDVVLLDIGLPDGPGWKVLDSIKQMQVRGMGTRMPAVIVITAYSDAANRLVGKLHGVYSYLVKPFTPSEVETLVRSAIARTN